MHRFSLLGLGCWLLGCSPQPRCAYVVCTQNVAQTCGQLQAVGDACGPRSSETTLSACEGDLEADCSESDSNGLANATGCFGAATECATAAGAIQSCFAAQTLGSECRSAALAQIKIFLPDGG